MTKDSNILIRVSEKENKIIKLKSDLFNTKKSKLILSSCMNYWNNQTSDESFKKLLSSYKTGTDGEKEIIIDLLFEYYNNIGFPYTVLSDEQKLNRMKRLENVKSPYLHNDELQQNTVSIELANCFHPHMEEVSYSIGNLKSPKYFFDTKLKDCIKTWLELGNTPNHSGIRRILRTRNGARGVSNFKPAIANYIYKNYCHTGGNALDPCSGFSGRLVGAISANKKINYTGIDPEPKTAIGNMQCASFFKEHYNFGFSFHLGCAEEEMLKMQKDYYDLIFTSPPYFNIENYSNSPCQSHHKFDSYSMWKSNFLETIITESKRILKQDGYFIINTKNYDNFPIADDLFSFAQKIGLKLKKTYQMRLANNEFNRSKSTFHHEPIFVFKK